MRPKTDVQYLHLQHVASFVSPGFPTTPKNQIRETGRKLAARFVEFLVAASFKTPKGEGPRERQFGWTVFAQRNRTPWQVYIAPFRLRDQERPHWFLGFGPQERRFRRVNESELLLEHPEMKETVESFLKSIDAETVSWWNHFEWQDAVRQPETDLSPMPNV